MDDRDADAFRALYRRHYRSVCRFLSTRTAPDHVEDLAAGTFLVAWRRAAGVPDMQLPWLLNVATKCLANHRRGGERREALTERLGRAARLDSPGVEADAERRRQQRTLYGRLELAEDQDARTLQTFDPARNELMDHTDPDYFARPPSALGDGGFGGMITIVGDLRALLQRAADHDDAGVELLGDTEVRGTAVHHLRITRTIDAIVADGPVTDPSKAPTRKVTTVRDVYISVDDNLPVRVVDHAEVGNRAQTAFDFGEAQRLPLNSQTASLLRMAPHPGAREVDEGPFR